MKGKTKEKQAEGMDDRQLVEFFLAGMEEAFDEIVIRNQDRVYTLCFRILGNRDDAVDCSQEVFIKVYRSLGNFQHKSALATWIYRIAVNTCRNLIDRREYRSSSRLLSLGTGFDSGTAQEDRIAGDGFDPVETFERGEMNSLIMEAINSLPEAQRIVVLLRDVEGKSYEEISGITGLKDGTIKSKLARARSRLRSLLEGKIE